MVPKVRSVKILKLPGKKSPYWYLRWWEYSEHSKAWKEKWKSTGTTVKKEAEAERRLLERNLEDGKRHESEMPWDDFVHLFMEKHVSRKPPSTQKTYQRCLNAFSKIGQPRNLAAVSHALLEDYATQRLKNGAAAATVNRDLRHVRASLKWAKRRGYISQVPDFNGVFVKEDRKKPTIIPEEDFLAMIRALNDSKVQLTKRSSEWWKVYLYIAYYLGLRRGEIFGLEWGHISLDLGEIRIVAPTSKCRKERVLPLAPELCNLLSNWKKISSQKQGQISVLQWPYENYQPMYKDWHAIQTAAKITEGKHYALKNCRSTCASALIASNVPTIVVKDFLGHATVATTENYYINTKPALRSAVAARKVQIEDDMD